MEIQKANMPSKTIMGIFFQASFWCQSSWKKKNLHQKICSHVFDQIDQCIYVPTVFLCKGAIFSMGNIFRPQIMADFTEINCIIIINLLYISTFIWNKIKAIWSRYRIDISSQKCLISPETLCQPNNTKPVPAIENNNHSRVQKFQGS